jgi:flagellin
MSGTRINHNMLSLMAQRSLYNTQQDMNTSIQRLSSGLRVNYAWDDPAALAVSERFRAQIASMDMAERNANYNVNLLATAEGALAVLDEKLVRMRALAIQASNGALTSEDRSYLNTEFGQMVSEVNRIANTTNYNGLYLLDGSLSGRGIKFHVGTFNTLNNDYYWVQMQSMAAADLGVETLVLTDTINAQNAITALDTAIERKDSERTRIGAFVNRLQHTIANLQVARENATASESEIRDTDIAREMSEFVRAQVLTQTGVAMLSQANQVPQMIAQLVG